MSEGIPTRRQRVDPGSPDPAVIHEAAALLRGGRLVAFPTETVYGLGANALDGAALRRIYAAKQRPFSDPIIAHVADLAQIGALVRDPPDSLYELARHFWPGPLTLVLRRADGVPDAIGEGLDTVAVRMPAHPVALALLTAAQVPVGAPSANRFTRPSATTAAHVMEDLDGRFDLLLDAGPTRIGVESTVLDLCGARPAILRPGGVSLERLREVLPDVSLSTRFLAADTASAAPGQMLKHYSPRARLRLFRGDDRRRVLSAMHRMAEDMTAAGERVGLLLSSEDAEHFRSAGALEILGASDDLEAIGRRLFDAMRRLDQRGVDAILVRDVSRAGLGEAIHDRLLRAAEGRTIDT